MFSRSAVLCFELSVQYFEEGPEEAMEFCILLSRSQVDSLVVRIRIADRKSVV